MPGRVETVVNDAETRAADVQVGHEHSAIKSGAVLHDDKVHDRNGFKVTIIRKATGTGIAPL